MTLSVVIREEEKDRLEVCIQLEKAGGRFYYQLLNFYPNPPEATVLWRGLCEESAYRLALLYFLEIKLECGLKSDEEISGKIEENHIVRLLRNVERYERRLNRDQIPLDKIIKSILRLKTCGLEDFYYSFVHSKDPMMREMAGRIYEREDFFWLKMLEFVKIVAQDESLLNLVRKAADYSKMPIMRTLKKQSRSLHRNKNPVAG